MDQASEFVKNQLAQGKTIEQVRTLLLSGGWQESQIEAVFAALELKTPVVPMVSTAPIGESTPSPVVEKPPARSAEPEASSQHLVVKPKKWLLPVLLAVITLAIIGGGGYWVYQKNIGAKNKTPVSGNTSTGAKTATVKYTGAGFSFDYPVTWSPKKTCELLENCSASNPSEQTLFMTAAQLQKANQAIADFKANPKADFASFFNLVLQFDKQLDLSYTANQTTTDCTPGVSLLDVNNKDMCAADYKPTETSAAKTAAEGLTQNICHGADTSYSTSNPIRTELVETITVSGKVAYGAKSDADCSALSYTVFLDVAKGYVELGFTAKDFASIDSEQKSIVESIKIL